jgi:hypothetical protein
LKNLTDVWHHKQRGIMLTTIKATIDKNKKVSFEEKIEFETPQIVLITFLTEETKNESAILSEKTLATDWLKPEEDQAWSHLQKGLLS